MAISGPINPKTTNPFVIPTASHPTRKMARTTPDQRAREAEKDAQRRVLQAQAQVEEAELHTSQAVEELREEYGRQYEQQNTRQETSLEAQRQKGNEAAQNLQRMQRTELNRIKRDGERELENVTSYYKNKIHTTERDGQQNLEKLRKDSTRSFEYEKNTADGEFSLNKDEYARRLATLREEQEEAVAYQTESGRQLFEKRKENAIKANQMSEEKFSEKAQRIRNQHETTLSNLYSRAKDSLELARLDSSEKLSAYTSRQTDPFYKLVNINATLSEHDDEFVLEATIPSHEQDNISINIRNNQIVVSGRRRNEEKSQLAPGRELATQSFQSFSETIPLPWPVDAKMLSRGFEGDTLVVRVPKKLTYTAEPYKAKQKPSRARLERPKFPENIPIAENKEEPATDVASSPKTVGGRTLT